MKRLGCLLGLLAVLTGCAGTDRPLSEAMEIRRQVLSGAGCKFTTEVTADYGDSVTEFTMDCQADPAGELTFILLAPESIAGIRGTISEEGGSIDFDGQAVYFSLLTDDLLTPASAPWIFLRTLRSGYLTSACREDQLLHITADDDYAEDALTVDIWLEDSAPVRADILHEGKRILSLQVESFELL